MFLHDKIAIEWVLHEGAYYGLSNERAKNISQAILPVYQELVRAGYPPYEIKDGDTARTMYAVVDKTGLERPVVVGYLATLERLAKSGEIDTKYYNPTVKKTFVESAIDTITGAKDIATAANIDPTSAAKWTARRIIIAGSIVGFSIYALNAIPRMVAKSKTRRR